MDMGRFTMIGLLLAPVLLTFAALVATFPGGAFKVVVGGLLGYFFIAFFFGFSMGAQVPPPRVRLGQRPMPPVRAMHKAPVKAIEVKPADQPKAIKVKPVAPAKAR